MKLQFCKFSAILLETQDKIDGLVSGEKKDQLNMSNIAVYLKSWHFYSCLSRKKFLKYGQQRF